MAIMILSRLPLMTPEKILFAVSIVAGSIVIIDAHVDGPRHHLGNRHKTDAVADSRNLQPGVAQRAVGDLWGPLNCLQRSFQPWR